MPQRRVSTTSSSQITRQRHLNQKLEYSKVIEGFRRLTLVRVRGSG